ncbi:MAG: asparagine synthase (glutamine-hydrolyzing) [Planctomycetota bacterium]
MCGLVGVLRLDGRPVDAAVLARMRDALAHRGPDDAGIHTAGPLGLAHRRLAVIDLSAAAHQPFHSDCGRYVLAYNGEVYNFRELRAELEALGRSFRSQSDTEVVLQAYAEWGLPAVERFNGMFAFALWDAQARELVLARDRYGIKPLYLSRRGGAFACASEVKALLAHPDFGARLDVPALSEYFTFQNLFSSRTFFQDVRLLPPGTTLVVQADGTERAQRYWDVRFSDRAPGSFEDCTEELTRRFEAAVTRQLVADVPLGSYLSGGLDSASITAVASRAFPRLHTFTCGFDLSSASGLELAFDEREVAEALANQFKTEHYQVVLHAGDMEHVLPQLVRSLETPRVGQSYPNLYVANLASKFVTCVLSGGGGDELFAGYPWRYYRGVEAGQSYRDAYYDYWQRLLPETDREAFFQPEVYRELRDHEPRAVFAEVFAQSGIDVETPSDAVNACLYFEIKTFLHGLLVVEDALSMARGLEARLPFLDNDLVDLALAIPPAYKLQNLADNVSVSENLQMKLVRYRNDPGADGKRVLRASMERLLPASVTRGRKQGFSAPDASWFRGESVDYVNRLLRDPGARIYAYLQPGYVQRVLDLHSSGKENRRLFIWALLNFEWWLRTFA